jgi:D-glycero-D-manno-heptose 1,7-bisphosphate phosphatase
VDERNRMKQPSLFTTFTDPRLAEDLLWRDVRVERFAHSVPALFLDRDGVVIEEREYISNPDEVELMSGIPELIRTARALGAAVVEITNQAGIARGYFGWHEFVQVENRVKQVLSSQGVTVDAVFACPFHPLGEPPYRHPDHPWRKPNAGMLLAAAKLLNLDLRRSALIGDKAMDQEAARAAGLAFGVHVLTGHGPSHEEASRATASKDFPVYVVRRAGEAVPLLRFESDECIHTQNRWSN